MQYYTFSVDCSFVCEEGFVPSSDCAACQVDNICLADNPCDNGECMLGSSPNEYTCNCTGTNYMGTNCSGINGVHYILLYACVMSI